MSNKNNPPTELERLYAGNAGMYVLSVVAIIIMVIELTARGTWAIVPVTLIGLTFGWYALALRWRMYRKSVK